MTSLSLIERAVQSVGADAVYESLTPDQRQEFRYAWTIWARPSQRTPPGSWLTWLIMAGRGWGKTKTGGQWIKERVDSGQGRRIALLGRTPADYRDTMVEGESGILSAFPPNQRPLYEPSKRRITFYNGAIATTFSAENPDQLRGPQHDTAWSDEVGTFQSSETFDNLQLGLRMGNPQQIVTTTPRPIKLIRDLIASPSTVVTRGSSYENRKNLAQAFYDLVISRYEGTRLGQQEIMGILLDEVPGALWSREMMRYRDEIPEMKRVVVAIDPSVTGGEESDECGIVGAGAGVDDNFYILADHSRRASPLGWAKAAIRLYDLLDADRLIAEVNNGGEMVELTLRIALAELHPGQTLRYTAVHASVGKKPRAEPIAALYEQGRVFHTQPFEHLEDQYCTWTPEDPESPDRLDAAVWALSELAGPRKRPGLRVLPT